MSKIIEKGIKQYECQCCGCKFEIEAIDIKYNQATDRFYTNGYYYAACPQCRSKVKIENYNK